MRWKIEGSLTPNQIRKLANRIEFEVDMMGREMGASPEEVGEILAFLADPDEARDQLEITELGDNHILDALTGET